MPSGGFDQRHPGYVGFILQSLSMPLLLGSWWALIPGIWWGRRGRDLLPL